LVLIIIPLAGVTSFTADGQHQITPVLCSSLQCRACRLNLSSSVVFQDEWCGVSHLERYSQGPGPRPTTQFTLLAEQEKCYWCWPYQKFAAPVRVLPAVQTSFLKTDCICILVAKIVWGFVISTLWSQRSKFLNNFAFSPAKGTTLCRAWTRLENKAVFKWKSPAFSSLHSYKWNMTSCFCHSSY